MIGKLYVKNAWFPNGDCSSMAECATVARKTRVRFSPFALDKTLGGFGDIDSALASQGSAKRVRFSPFALGFFFRKKETTVVEKTTRGVEKWVFLLEKEKLQCKRKLLLEKEKLQCKRKLLLEKYRRQ